MADVVQITPYRRDDSPCRHEMVEEARCAWCRWHSGSGEFQRCRAQPNSRYLYIDSHELNMEGRCERYAPSRRTLRMRNRRWLKRRLPILIKAK